MAKQNKQSRPLLENTLQGTVETHNGFSVHHQGTAETDTMASVYKVGYIHNDNMFAHTTIIVL